VIPITQPLISSLTSIPVLPSLLEDIIDKADRWGDGGTTGRIDPFTEVYDVSHFLEYRFLWC